MRYKNRPGWLEGAAGGLLASTLLACAAEPVLRAPPEILLGQAPAVVAEGLAPGSEYVLIAELTDTLERRWRSVERHRADDRGRIDVLRSTPVGDADEMRDPFAMLSSMAMPRAVPEGWVAPPPRAYNDLRFDLERGGRSVASARTRQWVVHPDIHREPIGNGLVGELFRPSDVAKPCAILLLGGSGGGMAWARRTGALLAAEGFPALALAYFNAEGLPAHLVEIPLEYVESAVDALAAHNASENAAIAVVGYSKGAELALLVASRRADIAAVAAIAPGSAVFQGFRPPDFPVVSSWSVDGVGLPFVPNNYDKKFFETFDGMYLWYRTLGQHEAVAAASIPVEKIVGDILLLSGVEDRIWPSTLMAEQIVARAYVSGFAHEVRHLAFAQAGHGIAAPPGEPLTSVAARLGGTVAGNASARAEGWRALVDFLEQTAVKQDR